MNDWRPESSPVDGDLSDLTPAWMSQSPDLGDTFKLVQRHLEATQAVCGREAPQLRAVE